MHDERRWIADRSSVLVPWRHSGAPPASGRCFPDTAQYRGAHGSVGFLWQGEIEQRPEVAVQAPADAALWRIEWGGDGVRQGRARHGAPPFYRGVRPSVPRRARQGSLVGQAWPYPPWKPTCLGLDGLRWTQGFLYRPGPVPVYWPGSSENRKKLVEFKFQIKSPNTSGCNRCTGLFN
jgi:hypothetical protein